MRADISNPDNPGNSGSEDFECIINCVAFFHKKEIIKGKARWQKITSVKINSYNASARQKGFLRLLT